MSTEEFFFQEEEKIYRAMDGKFSRSGIYAFHMRDISYKLGQQHIRVNLVGYSKKDVPSLVRSGWSLDSSVMQYGNYIGLYNSNENF
jgi:hypothetical protein